MQIKRTMSDHCLGSLRSGTQTIPNDGTLTAGGGAQGAATLEDSLRVSYKPIFLIKLNLSLNMKFSNHAPLWLSKRVENCVHRKTCTGMFIISLVLIAKT